VTDPVVGRRFDVRGAVQGVGFRPWVYRLARDHRLTGRVWNHAQGVTIEVFGPVDAIQAFGDALGTQAPPAARIDAITGADLASPAPGSFDIVPSEWAESRQVSIPPDLRVCDACLAEIADPQARRYRYAFTNCTNCGPRFTIALDVPYDRPSTTMARFPMCDACRAEYESPADRRFHAQPIACPACGPRLRLIGPDGAPVTGDDSHGASDPIEEAAARIRAGRIVAVKGLGGYLLACDATSSEAVTRLRQRKRREEKPFAVMVATLADAERLAWLDDQERVLLAGTEAPIVLCRARADTGLAPEVAPDTPLVGLYLAYAPLHRLLVDAVGRPVVMTSGNLSEEPLAHRDGEALARLASIADAWLSHDRDIAAPCDDSVARVVGGAPMLLRRARGYVPRPIALKRPVPAPVLACGGLLKNTFCLAEGDRAWLGPHVGDLDNLATTTFFEEAVARMERFTRIAPQVFAHDLHPDLHSTTYARRRAEGRAAAVQHHHAHVCAVMAEHGIEGPVLGLAYDGTGYGTDGAAWGGELLLADAVGFTRLATFRPLALAGGDKAVRDVWRLALAVVLDAFGRAAPIDALPVLRDRPANERQVVQQMLERRLNSPPAHGVGRYFDAFGALVLNRPRASYEGQIAMACNQAAIGGDEGNGYPFDLDTRGDGVTVDLRDATRALVTDLLEDAPVRTLAARFHRTVVNASVELVRRAVAAHGRLPVVLGGGCFQNRELAEDLVREFTRDGLAVWLPRDVPPGDGGISLGQVLVAAAGG
jgi:hydrogenase maturation protein HypF